MIASEDIADDQHVNDECPAHVRGSHEPEDAIAQSSDPLQAEFAGWNALGAEERARIHAAWVLKQQFHELPLGFQSLHDKLTSPKGKFNQRLDIVCYLV